MADQVFTSDRCNSDVLRIPEAENLLTDTRVADVPPPIPSIQTPTTGAAAIPVYPPAVPAGGGDCGPPPPWTAGEGPPVTTPDPGSIYVDNSTGDVYQYDGDTWTVITQVLPSGGGPFVAFITNVCETEGVNTSLQYELWRLPAGSQFISQFCVTPNNVCCEAVTCADNVTLPNGCVLPKCLCAEFALSNDLVCYSQLQYIDHNTWSGTITILGEEYPLQMQCTGSTGDCADWLVTFAGELYNFSTCDCDPVNFVLTTVTIPDVVVEDEALFAMVTITNDSADLCEETACEELVACAEAPDGAAAAFKFTLVGVTQGTSGGFPECVECINVNREWVLPFNTTPINPDDFGTCGPITPFGECRWQLAVFPTISLACDGSPANKGFYFDLSVDDTGAWWLRLIRNEPGTWDSTCILGFSETTPGSFDPLLGGSFTCTVGSPTSWCGLGTVEVLVEPA